MGFDRKGDKKRSERFYIIVPPEMVHDERFPLRPDEAVMLRAEGRKLVVMRVAGIE